MSKEEIVRRILLQMMLLRHNGKNELPVDTLITRYRDTLKRLSVSASEKRLLSDHRSIMSSLHALWNAGKIAQTSEGIRLTTVGKSFAQRDYTSILTTDFPEFTLPEAA